MNATIYDSVLPKNISELISKSGYKQGTIARQSGFSQRVFRDMLNGRRIIKPIDIVNISNALGVTPNEIFGVNSDKQAS